jgi:hypothetical protein
MRAYEMKTPKLKLSSTQHAARTWRGMHGANGKIVKYRVKTGRGKDWQHVAPKWRSAIDSELPAMAIPPTRN